jgi:hypothetical protein
VIYTSSSKIEFIDEGVEVLRLDSKSSKFYNSSAFS